MTRAYVRWMVRRDMPYVLAIEHASFAHPWCEERFLRHLRDPHKIGMVAEAGDDILGFMIYEMHKGRLHILNFAVHPEHRRQGIGHQMAAKLIGKLSAHRRTLLTLEIRESNLAGQLFWKAMGFRATGVLRERYTDEDGYAMEYALAPEPALIPAWATEDDGRWA